ncbi:PDZ domain-containing protein, partial [Candidatus Aerophobetes bacterium]
AKRLLDSLVQYGEIRRPWIGIYMQELTPELEEKFGVKKGVLVVNVIKGSPADKASIQAEDIIQKVNGKPVDSGLDLREEILKTEIGEEITLTLVRKGKEMNITFPTGQEQEEIVQITEGGLSERLLGIQVHSINPELEKEYDLKEGEKGVVVIEVDSGSPAAQAGINVGDVIKAVRLDPVDEGEVDSLREFEEAMRKVKPGDTVALRVRHGIVTMWVTVLTQK